MLSRALVQESEMERAQTDEGSFIIKVNLGFSFYTAGLVDNMVSYRFLKMKYIRSKRMFSSLETQFMVTTSFFQISFFF